MKSDFELGIPPFCRQPDSIWDQIVAEDEARGRPLSAAEKWDVWVRDWFPRINAEFERDRQP